MKKRVIVIGAGYAGLSMAAFLASRGHEVEVLEKNPEIGGRARLWEDKGYKFDMGPSWYLMPEVFERFFKLFGKDINDYLTIHKLKTYYKVFYEGHEPVRITEDFEKTKALFESFEPNGAKKLVSYMEKAEYKYKTAMSEFVYKEYKSIFDFFNWKILTEGLKLDIFATLDSFVRKYFTDICARQILEYAMVFLGASPANAPALYSIMSHVDLKLGVWFPKGGMNAVAQAIAKLATEHGAKVRTGIEVKKILVENGRAVGVLTDEGTLPADLVINSGDYAWGETKLLEPEYQTYKPRFWEKRTMAPSMFIVYLGGEKEASLP
ncbi:phytoene desaturase family protein [Thermospira aquatica]|uniref:phytoene desaturase family protein n=1 Tax=Thermospira aquatica TaxID=2828656 RepID=UPI002303FED2|nr:phytoene desaturase family protein [Thermospira aquatica]